MNRMRSFKFVILLLAAACSDSSDAPADVVVTPGNFLKSSPYTSLVVEIVSVSGFAPSATAVDNLKAFLQARLNKPVGIIVTQSNIASPGKTAYTIDDVMSIESATRKQRPIGNTLSAYLLLLDGDYAGNSGSSKVLGFAYASSSMTLFEKTVKDFSGGVSQPAVATLETTVMEHEFGHILGLVNNGTTPQSSHQDNANGKHCTNTNCLMYFNVETSDVVANLLGGTVPTLDAACIADLQANGGK